MKKTLSLLTITLLLNFAFAPSMLALAKDKEAELTEKVKTEVSKLGVGQDAKIKLKLKDGTKIKGYVVEANENQFVVMNSKTGQAVPVAYPQVGQAKGNNLSTGTILIIGAVGLLVVLLILASNIS